MTAMAASWRWHPMAIVRSALAALLLLATALLGEAAAQTQWVANDKVKLSVLIEDGALAADWQLLTDSRPNDDISLTAVTRHGPRETALAPVLSLPFAEAGLSTAILYVVPETESDAFDDHKTRATLLAEALNEDQTLVLVHATESGWQVFAEISGTAPPPLRQTALDNLALPEAGEAQTPAELMDARAEARRFVILGAGEAATEVLAELSTARGERYFVNTAGFGAPLPSAFLPLGDLSDDARRAALFDTMSEGQVAVFDMEIGGSRLPGEADAATVLSLDMGAGVDPLQITFPANLPPAPIATLISPVNGFAWLATPGRRLYGLVNLLVWGALIGLLVLIVRLPRGGRNEDVPVLARIELYGLGLSADVQYLPFTIGRSASCDLVADHEETSRRHAQIRRNSAGELELVDLMSANGTFLDGDRLNQPAALTGSQAVTFGGVRGHIHLVSLAHTDN